MRLAERKWLSDLLLAAAVYAVSAVPVLAGLTVASTPGVLVHKEGVPGFLDACVSFDGCWYRDVADCGYWYFPDRQSGAAFFPGMPLAARFVSALTGCPTPVALLVVSNLSFVAALALISALVRTRWPDAPPGLRVVTLAVLAFYPAGLYFRVAYSESLFLALTALLMLGLARRWPVWVLAVVAGAATGVRPVGVAGAAAVVVSVLSDPARGSPGRRVLTAAAVGPLACWGLLAFMAYQWAEFGDPLTFAKAHEQWKHYVRPDGDTTPAWVKLATGEPLWNTYVPGSPRHWWHLDGHHVPGLGQGFWNPIAVTLAAAAVGLGWWRGWLGRAEAVLGFGLILIPYLSRAHEMCMASQSRFTSVVVPAFLVYGRALGRLPPAAAGAVVAVMSPMLAVWTMMFGAMWFLF
ncbi:MAG TPA: hypothetical protein VM529_12305 [Gemmata sp.]|nr:hypothetical protein [Gemmata sp.]